MEIIYLDTIGPPPATEDDKLDDPNPVGVISLAPKRHDLDFRSFEKKMSEDTRAFRRNCMQAILSDKKDNV